MSETDVKQNDARKRAEALIAERGFDWRGYDDETLISDVVCSNDPELLREMLNIFVEKGLENDMGYQLYIGDDDNITAMEIASQNMEMQKVLAEFGFESFRPQPPRTHGCLDDSYESYIKSIEDGTWALKEAVYKVADFAYQMHQRDTPPREGSGLPYIVHPAAVVRMLESWGYNADTTPVVIALGWAHDLKEDTAVTDEEIVKAGGTFGRHLLEGVTALTFTTYAGSRADTEGARNETEAESAARKAAYIRKVAESDPEFLVVKIADRICNTKERSKTDPARALKYLEKGKPLFERVDELQNGARIRQTLNELYGELKK